MIHCLTQYFLPVVIGVLIVIVVGCLAGVSLIIHVRRQRRTTDVLQERRETVHRSLIEAFGSHQSSQDNEEAVHRDHRSRMMSASHSYSNHRRATPATTIHDLDDDSDEDRPIIFHTERDSA